MKKTLLTIACCLATIVVFGKPARREPIVVSTEDGSETVVYLHGDERFHWATNQAGEWIAEDEAGAWRKVPSLTEDQIAERRANSRYTVAEQARNRKHAMTEIATPINVAEHGLIILVNFADLEFQTDLAEMDSMHNAVNYTRDYTYTYYGQTQAIRAEGSARRYFQDASFGQYNPKFDVVGPVTVSETCSYYGGNDRWGNDQHPEQMVYEACLLADSLYDIDFSLYDNDGDGEMDYVYIVYAGYGEADGGGSNTIWPHSYWITYGGYSNLVIDGVKVDKYACGNELSYMSKQHDGIGTFVHEFGHVLGLPDFYCTTYSSHRTLGDWDVMDYGPYNNDGNNPPTYSGYERFFFGWATPVILTDTCVVTLHDLLTTNEVLLISESDKHNLIGNDPSPTTFYILENRQPNIWDEHLAGHGMMLTKVQYSYSTWANNTVNNTRNSLGVDIIEAKMNNTSSNKATDLFPAGATSYTKITNHPIYEIEESEDGVITFKYLDENPTATKHTLNSQDNPIVAIYDISGRSMSLQETLPSGMYIIRRANGTEKIVIR